MQSMYRVYHQPFISNFDVIVIILLLAVLAIIRFYSGKYTGNVLQAGFNLQTANRLYREQVATLLHPSVQLEILYYFSGAVFLLHIEKLFLNELPLDQEFILALNAVAIFLYSKLKFLFYRLSAFLFESKEETEEYLFYVRISNWLSGIFLTPIAIIMYFTREEISTFFLILSTIIILILNVISRFRGAGIILRKDFSIYYLILYLCTLEILPLLAVWRILWRVYVIM